MTDRWVIAYGEMLADVDGMGGLSFVGPFETEEEATDYAEDRFVDIQWWPFELQTPRPSPPAPWEPGDLVRILGGTHATTIQSVKDADQRGYQDVMLPLVGRITVNAHGRDPHGTQMIWRPEKENDEPPR